MSKIFFKNNQKILLETFKKVFPKKKHLKKIDNLEINSFVEWDSIGNLNLLLEVEKKFGFKFSMEEMSEIKSIKQIKLKIKNFK